eukprot:11161-Heterococcus_DN1.PRE.1
MLHCALLHHTHKSNVHTATLTTGAAALYLQFMSSLLLMPTPTAVGDHTSQSCHCSAAAAITALHCTALHCTPHRTVLMKGCASASSTVHRRLGSSAKHFSSRSASCDTSSLSSPAL